VKSSTATRRFEWVCVWRRWRRKNRKKRESVLWCKRIAVWELFVCPWELLRMRRGRRTRRTRARGRVERGGKGGVDGDVWDGDRRKGKTTHMRRGSR
jgi:hypothetical protein